MSYQANSIFFLLIGCLTCFSANSQVPDSVAITTSGSWVIEHSEATQNWDPLSNTYIWSSSNDYYYYRSGGDTLINGMEYTKLLRTIVQPNGDGSYSSNSSYELYMFAYRNDMNKRAFKVPIGMTTEELWYDFNYGVGETILNPMTVMQTPFLVVSLIDSTNYCGLNYRRLNFDTTTEFSIERMGSTTNFLGNYTSGLIRDKTLYFCEESPVFSEIAEIEDIYPTTFVSLYPNPTRNSVHLLLTNKATPTQVIVTSLSGKAVFQDNSGLTSFSVENLTNGVYFVTVEISNTSETLRLIKD
jgi:hypothetical protein